MSKCEICKGCGQIKIAGTVQEEISGIMTTVPKMHYLPCPTCKIAELEQMYITLLNDTVSKYESKFDDLTMAHNGAVASSVFIVDAELARTAKENPHELLQRLLTDIIDDMKETIFANCIYKCEYNMQDQTYTILTKLNIHRHAAQDSKSEWKDLSQFDDWLCKNVL